MQDFNFWKEKKLDETIETIKLLYIEKYINYDEMNRIINILKAC